MQALFSLAERCSAPLLRLSLGVVLGWIGALKFVDPTPVVGLLRASFSFLAYPELVYGLGAAEVAAAALLFLGVAQRWVGALCMGLFSGTLAIFVIAPAVSYGEAGFPSLSLAGQFLLKDLVLFAASLALVGLAPRSERVAAPAGVRTRAKGVAA
jgi:uncharacterized membrane protein YkgB